MRRGIQFAISLLAVLLLLRPFDCFAAGALSQKAADCCVKGKCAPTADSDECCKSAAPDAGQLATSKAPDHSSPLIVFTPAHNPTLISPFSFECLTAPGRHPPPRAG